MTRTMVALVALVLALSHVGSAAWAQPETYLVDEARTELVVFLYKAGPAARLAHDHVIEAQRVSGRITYDPQAATIAMVITAEAASLKPDAPELLERYGVKGPTDPEDRAEIEEALQGDDQLHVERYPTIRFESTALERTPTGERFLTGAFTLRGVTREMRVPVTIELRGDVLRGKGSFVIEQSAFGYEPYSSFFGAVRVKDEARIQFDVVARRADGASIRR